MLPLIADVTIGTRETIDQLGIAEPFEHAQSNHAEPLELKRCESWCKARQQIEELYPCGFLLTRSLLTLKLLLTLLLFAL